MIGMHQCLACRHFHRGSGRGATWTCDAYPDGIPVEIRSERVIHTVPHPGDHGIRFELDGEYLDSLLPDQRKKVGAAGSD